VVEVPNKPINKNSGIVESQTKENNVLLNIKFLEVTFRLSIPREIEEPFLKNYPNWLPFFKITDERPLISINVYRGEPNLTIREDTASLSNHANDKKLAIDTILLLSRLLERRMNELNLFSLHASGVSSEGDGIAIVGPKVQERQPQQHIHVCLTKI
jgi:hypothetical protein